MKRAHKLIAEVNKSTKATEMLINKAGKKLITDCPIYWSCTFFYHACLQLTNQIAPFQGNKLINYLIFCREVDK